MRTTNHTQNTLGLDNDCNSSDGSGEGIHDMMDDSDHLQALDEEDDPFSLHNIMEAMDHELRTDVASHPTIKNLSVASEEDGSGGTDVWHYFLYIKLISYSDNFTSFISITLLYIITSNRIGFS